MSRQCKRGFLFEHVGPDWAYEQCLVGKGHEAVCTLYSRCILGDEPQPAEQAEATLRGEEDKP